MASSANLRHELTDAVADVRRQIAYAQARSGAGVGGGDLQVQRDRRLIELRELLGELEGALANLEAE